MVKEFQQKKTPNTYKIQKDIAFAYVVLGTMISGFTNFTSLLSGSKT